MKISLKYFLAVGFAIIILLTVSVITFFSYRNTSESINSLVNDLMTQISERTIEKTISHLYPAQDVASNFNRLIHYDRKNIKQMLLFFYNQLVIHKQFYSIYFGNQHGEFYQVKRDKNDNIYFSINKNNTSTILNINSKGNLIKKEIIDELYDPRQRPWYQINKKNNTPIWTDAYIYSLSKIPGITISYPTFSSNKSLIGVVGIDITVENISRFLKTVKIGKSGKTFIINKNKDIIASSDTMATINVNQLGSKKTNKTPEANKNSELINQSYSHLTHSHHKGSFFTLQNNGTNYYVKYTPFPKSFPKKWMIGIIVPENDFMALANENNFLNLMISIASLILSLIVAFWFSKKISEPLAKLEMETIKIRRFEINTNGEKINTRFKEIDNMYQSFGRMKTGLKSFAKYVPADIVRYLVESNQEAKLGGTKKEVTLYFLDVADFTTISEQLTPEALVEQLGEYLEEMSHIIVKHEGTLDKYIGDAIMAFWGAPKIVDKPAVKACYAAIDTVDRLIELQKDWKRDNKPLFHTRIGIHSGECIVGNIGSKQRLNYTALGDNVNVASRLENINKKYGTSICISESTYELAKDDVEARIMDIVTVKGRIQPVKIYELISRKNQTDNNMKQVIDLCFDGFNLYLERDFSQSEKAFKEVLRLKPDDIVANMLIYKCKMYIEIPPDDSWNGCELKDNYNWVLENYTKK